MNQQTQLDPRATLRKKQIISGTAPHGPVGSAALYALPQFDPRALLRKRQIISGTAPLLPVGNTAFYALIQEGRFPKPRKIGRASVWPAAEVFAAIEKLTAEG